MLISQRIENFLGGVSQADERLRDPSQGSVQLNCLTDARQGLTKRPPLVFDSQVDTSATNFNSGAFVHTIERDTDEKFRAIIRNGDVKVYRVSDGSEFTVYAPEGKAYLTGNNFRAVSLGNTTMIVNQDTVVDIDTTEQADRSAEAMIFVRQADYSTSYIIRIDDTISAAIVTPDSDAAGARLEIDTNEIARQLHNKLLNLTDFSTNFTSERFGSTIYITRIDGEDFNVKTEDGLADKGLLAVKDSVQRVEDLPFRAKDGFTVEVTGDPGTDYDNHWMVYDEGENPEDYGIWRETAKPGVPTKLDRTTMPHELVLDGALSLRDSVKGPPVDPLIIATPGGISDDGDWTNFTDDTGSTALSGGDTATITQHDSYLSMDVDAAAASKSTTFDVGVAADTSRMDPGTAARLYLELYDGVSTWTALDSVELVAGVNSRVVRLSAQATPAASGAQLRIRLEYAAGVTPSDVFRLAAINPLTEDQTPVVTWTDPKFGEITIVRPPVIWTYQLTRSVYFGKDRQYPPAYQIRLTVGATNFDYTPSAVETGEQVAAGLQALVDADANYTAWDVGGGELRISDVLTNQPAPTVTHTYTFLRTTHAWFEDLDTDDLTGVVGAIAKNITDGSTGTITAVDGKSIVVGGGLSGGIDNTFEKGDIVEIVQSGTYFTFRPTHWRSREVGDLTTNPWPTFVDNKIKDVVYYQNRLGFVYRDEIWFSQTNDLLNLMRQTATILRADDAFGAQSASAKEHAFHSAVVFNKQLYCQSENGLVQVTGSPFLSPSTVAMDDVGAFESTPEVRPAVLGNRLFLPRKTDDGVSVTEVFPTDAEGSLAGRDVTFDIPSYIQGTPEVLFGSDALGILLLITDDSGTKRTWVYRFADDGRERLMSSWSEWTFPPDMDALGGSVVDQKIGILFKGDYDATIHTIDPIRDLTASTEKIAYLDRRVDEVDATPTYSAPYTTWTLPYEIGTGGGGGTLVIYNRTTNEQIPVFDRPSLTTVRASGDYTATNVWIGVVYTQQFDPTRIYYRDPRTGVPDTRGRIQCLRGYFEYHDSTDFTVTPSATGKTMQAITLDLSAPADGILNVPLLTRNTELSLSITNATPGSCNLTALDWEGTRVVRSRRS